MHSSQVNFYMLPEQFSEVEKFFKEMSCLFVPIPIKNKMKISSISFSDGYFSTIYITYGSYINDIKLKWINEQNYYLVDELTSPVIEFVRGSLDKETNKFSRSRLYYIKRYWEGEKLVSKDIEFIKWADLLVKEFKKRFLIKDDNKVFMFTELARKYIVEYKPELIYF